MTDLVFYFLVFLVVGSVFLFSHLLMGKLIRPSRPDAEKLTIYECGEPPVGSAWIQFDLRYYVVALLFVVFDVEVAFFFPWAIVFGDLNRLAKDVYPPNKDRAALVAELTPPVVGDPAPQALEITPAAARGWAWVAFFDILVFFGVLLVGFAYLWRRGDIDWVRAVAPRPAGAAEDLPPQEAVLGEHLRIAPPSAEPVGAGKH